MQSPVTATSSAFQLSSLRFASRMKLVTTEPAINEKYDAEVGKGQARGQVAQITPLTGGTPRASLAWAPVVLDSEAPIIFGVCPP